MSLFGGSPLRAALIGLAPLVGCGGSSPYELAPVSGVVTLDGEAVPYTRVTFQPRSTGDPTQAGPSSVAECDDAGRFVLKTIPGDDGAVVGTHTVRISSLGPPRDLSGDTNVGPPPVDAFPAEYNTNSTLTFDVPEGGTTEANFALKKWP
jgi:hypothetical protein